MALKGNIREDLKEAVKNREELKSSVLRLLLAAIFNKEKEKRYKFTRQNFPKENLGGLSKEKQEELEKESALTDEEVIEVISSEIKKRKEAIDLYEKGNRPELAEKEKKELEILEKYLPEQLSEEEIKKLVKEVIDKTVVKEIHPVKSAEGGVPPKAEQFNRVKDMGKVMQEVMPKVKGKADGSLVSKIVRELLET